MDLADIYRTFHPTAAEYILLKYTFSRIDLMTVTKQVLANLGRLKSYQISFLNTVE